MRSLRRIWGVIVVSKRIRNKEIHKMASTSEDVTVEMKKNMVSCFGHVDRMIEERMAYINIYVILMKE